MTEDTRPTWRFINDSRDVTLHLNGAKLQDVAPDNDLIFKAVPSDIFAVYERPGFVVEEGHRPTPDDLLAEGEVQKLCDEVLDSPLDSGTESANETDSPGPAPN